MRINRPESFEQYHQDENYSSEDSISTYSESWMLIDSTTIYWPNYHQIWKWLWKKKIERFLKLLFKIFLHNEMQNNSSKNDLSFKSSCLDLYSVRNNQNDNTREKKNQKCVKISLQNYRNLWRNRCCVHKMPYV